jgi:hypothetical protein
MRLTLFALSLVLASFAHAAELRLALFEEATKQTTYHSLNLDNGNFASAPEASGSSPAAASIYRIANYKLEAAVGGPPLMDATEILAQASTAGFHVLVIREEYNSFSNPFRWLAAFAGHPIQVSKVLWVVLKDGKVLYRKELHREPSSYQWRAQLFEQPTPVVPQ